MLKVTITKKSIFKNMSIVTLGTFFSRITGLIRDQSMAILFGASSTIVPDAYYAAFKIPNSLRNLLAEGGMTAAFLPTFKEYHQKDQNDASNVSNIVFTFLSIILIILTILGIVFSPEIIYLTASGFFKDKEKFNLAVLLLRIFFPYLYFISIAALAASILNSFYHFTIPSITPVLLNISIITAALISSKFLPEPVIGVGIGVLIGGFFQLAIQLPVLYKYRFLFKLNFNYKHPALEKIFRLLVPTLFTFSIYEITAIIEQQIASHIQQGTISVLYFANRLYQLPLALFAIALSSAMLPALSESIANNDFEKTRKHIHLGIKTIFALSLPSAMFLFIFSTEIFEVLFQYGKFSSTDTYMCAQALRLYSIGLIFISFYRIFNQAFYAMKDTKTPAISSGISLVFFAILAPTLAFLTPLRFLGLPLATALTTTLNFSILLFLLDRKIKNIIKLYFDKNILKILIYSSILFVCFIVIYFLKINLNISSFMSLLLSALTTILVTFLGFKFLKISLR